MLLNAEERSGTALPLYDLCIIGSGPAGLGLCNELKASGLRICIVESGTLEKSPFADGLRAVDDDGIRVEKDGQERIFGGTSATWAGLCAPLDAVDFIRRPFGHHIGWPFSRADLERYYERAALQYAFPAPEMFKATSAAVFGGADAEMGKWQRCEEKVFLKPSPIYRFGVELREELEKASGVDVVTDATVTRLESSPATDGATSCVTAAVCRTSGGQEFRVRARVFVLATGGIETPRILLNSKSPSGASLGNEHDQVGRYLMNHPKGRSGAIYFQSPIEAGRCFSWKSYANGVGFAGVRLREGVQMERQVLNSYVMVCAQHPWSNRDEPEAFRAIIAELRSFLPHLLRRKDYALTDRALWKRYFADLGSLRGRWRGIRQAAWQAFCALPQMTVLTFQRLTKDKARVGAVGFFNYLEMEPHPENRVTLGERRDPFGVPVPVVRHATTARDLESVLALHEEIRREFAAQGHPGELVSDTAALAKNVNTDACHYLGTARMGVDPRVSVVDPNLRVHSVENLYVAGGAVFPSSGCANPTLTIVALSIRLAEHLQAVCRQAHAEEAVARG